MLGLPLGLRRYGADLSRDSMDGRERRTRFEERVRIERQFLVPVNRRYGEGAPLAGLTGAAIDSWERRAGELGDPIGVAKVAGLLREAARRAELLSDNSRDVFEAGRRVGPDGLSAISRLID